MIETPTEMRTTRGSPEHIRSDIGPEFTAGANEARLPKWGQRASYI